MKVRDKLEGTEFQKKIEKMLWNQSPPGKWCAINSLKHLSKSWEICDIDPEMAFFRCSCAEEEAAKALFHSLKRCGYKGAKKLGLKKHWQKFSVIPFIWAVKKYFSRFPSIGINTNVAIIDREGKDRLEVHLKFQGDERTYIPDPPLHFIAQDDTGPYSDFRRQIDSLSEIGDTRNLMDYLHQGAKNRRDILYAHEQGIPTIKKARVERFIQNQLQNVTEMLTLYLLIDPYNVQQLFVQQCLNAFLRMLNEVPEEFDPEFP